jgi:Zn-finger nucleic acid-binding protein
MNCPNCGISMRIVNKFGAEIDICPDCKGVWLDRGELEKIIEVIASGGTESMQDRRGIGDSRRRDHDDDDDDDRGKSFDRDDDRERSGSRGYKRRRSWLGDLFGGGDD